MSASNTACCCDSPSQIPTSKVWSVYYGGDSVVCHTDLSTCCSCGQGIHRGDWYFPDATRLPFAIGYTPIGEGRAAQVAVIQRTTAAGPTGIYRCDIPTNAVHDETDNSVRDTVYIGLYTSTGGILHSILSLV